MNSASLLLSFALLGQTGTAAQPSVGPRYQSSTAATEFAPAGAGVSGPARTAQGLPILPGRKPQRKDAPSMGPGRAGEIGAAPVELAPANDGSGEVDSINLPATVPGAAVGSNPFSPPVGANPLRGSEAEIPSASAVGSEPAYQQTPVYTPNQLNTTSSPDQAYEVPGAAAVGEVEPRQFVPIGSLDPQEPASSFVPAVVDEHVTPASVPADSRLVSVQPPETEPTPERLLREALTPPELNSLAGKPLTLDELLGSYQSVGERHATVVRTYWRLCSAIARYHWALEELRMLEQVTAGRQVPFAATAELAAMRARVLQTKAAAVEAQHAVAAFRARPAGTELPLPVDRPVVAAYRTYYESLFANRSEGETARHAQRLNDTLPLHLEAARALADAVALAEDSAQPNSNATQQGQLDLNALLQALRHLHTQREAFIAEVQLYNTSIADYALLTVSPGSSAATLLPMLIKVKPRTDAVTGVMVTPQPSIPAIMPVAAAETIPAGAIITPNGVIPAGAEFPVNGGQVFAPVEEKPLRSVLVRTNRR